MTGFTGNIEAIIFDMGGTLRTREPHEPTQRASYDRMAELLGVGNPTAAFWQELERRERSYVDWAEKTLVEASEEEIWTRWMAPDLPRERVVPAAKELVILWRDRLGQMRMRPDAERTLNELIVRGYRLAVISNTLSSIDLPRTLKETGMDRYFEIVVLSSTSKRRKPDPQLFWEATQAMQIQPAHCVYVGDRISRDIVGAHRAGFASAILIAPSGRRREDDTDQVEEPDCIIRNLADLLDLFPPRPASERGFSFAMRRPQ